MATKMVRLHSVEKKYPQGRFGLKNISFEIEPGEFLFITGANGAGKSTLLKLLFAMEKPSSGMVLVNNMDLAELPKRKIPLFRREVGYVFQDFRLIGDLTIAENIGLPLQIRGFSKEDQEYRVKGVMALVKLEGREMDYPSTLSRGEQQRVAIARSIVGKPTLLLADEPTGNLDSKTTKEIMGLFREINTMGTTVVIATHDESFIREEKQARVIVLNHGLIALDQKPSLNS